MIPPSTISNLQDRLRELYVAFHDTVKAAVIQLRTGAGRRNPSCRDTLSSGRLGQGEGR